MFNNNGGNYFQETQANARRSSSGHGHHFLRLEAEDGMEHTVPLGSGRGMSINQPSAAVIKSWGTGRSIVGMHQRQQFHQSQVFPRMSESSPGRFIYGSIPDVSEEDGRSHHRHNPFISTTDHNGWTDASEHWMPMEHQSHYYPGHAAAQRKANINSNTFRQPQFENLDDVSMEYRPATPSPPRRKNSVGAEELSDAPQLKANIIDWDSVDEAANMPAIPRRKNNTAMDYEGSEKSFPSAIHGSGVSDRHSGMFRSTYDAIRNQHKATETVNSSNMMDMTSDDLMMQLERKMLYGSMVDSCSHSGAVDLKSEAAVGMPLDHVIVQNNILYNRALAGRPNCENYCHNNNNYRTIRALPDVHESSQRKRTYGKTFVGQDVNVETDMGGQLFSSFHSNQKRGRREENKSAVIHGKSVAFEYGDNIHFDWRGIIICVEYLIEAGCTDISVIVPENRVKQVGMSKNEHFIDQVKKYLRPSWESRCEKRFAIKTAFLRNSIIISNNVWNGTNNISSHWKVLKNRTFGFDFISPSKIVFTTASGQSLEEALRTY